MCRRIVKLEMHLEKLLCFMVIANRQSQKSYLHGEVRVIRSSLIAVHCILRSEQVTFTTHYLTEQRKNENPDPIQKEKKKQN